MDMVGHQHIGVDVTLMFFSRFPECFKIEAIVLFVPKNRLPVIATLNDVLGLAGNHETGKARHKECYLLPLSVNTKNSNTIAGLFQGV